MKQYLSGIFSFLLLVGACSQTHAMPTKPYACPDAQIIKAAGLAYSELDEDGYVVFQISNYGTQNTWAFAMGDIQAGSTQEALGYGYMALGSLYGNPSPVAIASENLWACIYSNTSGLISMAVTPLPMGARVVKTMKLNLH